MCVVRVGVGDCVCVVVVGGEAGASRCERLFLQQYQTDEGIKGMMI